MCRPILVCTCMYYKIFSGNLPREVIRPNPTTSLSPPESTWYSAPLTWKANTCNELNTFTEKNHKIYRLKCQSVPNKKVNFTWPQKFVPMRFCTIKIHVKEGKSNPLIHGNQKKNSDARLCNLIKENFANHVVRLAAFSAICIKMVVSKRSGWRFSSKDETPAMVDFSWEERSHDVMIRGPPCPMAVVVCPRAICPEWPD